MAHRLDAKSGCVAAAIVAFAACSAPTPTSPNEALSSADANEARGQSFPGTYVLSFLDNSLQPVTTLPVLTEELILKGHVEDLSGRPATSGTITFQYCSYKGLPPNDITRPDEAPLSACLDGSAAWNNLRGVSVNQNGDALLDFGIVRIPRTVGFRIKFNGGRSDIASGIGGPADFTWTASPSF